jgi:Tti2 family
LTLLSTTIDGTGKLSSERFDQLCSLLGEGIISGIWLYAEDKPEVMLATFDSLPQLIAALGIGTMRFMKVG